MLANYQISDNSVDMRPDVYECNDEKNGFYGYDFFFSLLYSMWPRDSIIQIKLFKYIEKLLSDNNIVSMIPLYLVLLNKSVCKWYNEVFVYYWQLNVNINTYFRLDVLSSF